jgi:hypothetical protein
MSPKFSSRRYPAKTSPRQERVGAVREPRAANRALAVLAKLERALVSLEKAGTGLEDAIHAAQAASLSPDGVQGFSTFENLPVNQITEARCKRVLRLVDAHLAGLSPAVREELMRARGALARTVPDEVARELAAMATPKERPPK